MQQPRRDLQPYAIMSRGAGDQAWSLRPSSSAIGARTTTLGGIVTDGGTFGSHPRDFLTETAGEIENNPAIVDRHRDTIVQHAGGEFGRMCSAYRDTVSARNM